MKPMRTMLPSLSRAIIGAIAFVVMTTGAGMLWGAGGALFAGGLFIALDQSSDEAIERITNTKRGFPPE